MQAQGSEKQCPLVGVIQIGGKLTGIEFNDRDRFCYLQMDVQKYSKGIPQIPKDYTLTPMTACKTVTRELLRQIDYVRQNPTDDETKKIYARWKEVVTKNKNVGDYDFKKDSYAATEKEINKKVVGFAKNILWSGSLGCSQEPHSETVHDDELA